MSGGTCHLHSGRENHCSSGACGLCWLCEAGPCILWPGAVDRRGYGKWRGSNAHRRFYEANNGPIPQGMTVDHICFNPSCVNPAHLRLMTSLENKRNQRSATKNHCVNGHEYTPENTYRRTTGGRDCRACIRDRTRRYLSRKAAS